AYGYSVFIFVIMFILFYLLIDGSNGYLAYIIASFFLFPFAKVLFDWIGVYKFRQKLEKQKGATYYLHQIEIFFDAILFRIIIFTHTIKRKKSKRIECEKDITSLFLEVEI